MKTTKIRGSTFSFLSVIFIFIFIFYFNFITENKSFFISKESKVKTELNNTKSILLVEQIDKNIDLQIFNTKKEDCLPKQLRD